MLLLVLLGLATSSALASSSWSGPRHHIRRPNYKIRKPIGKPAQATHIESSGNAAVNALEIGMANSHSSSIAVGYASPSWAGSYSQSTGDNIAESENSGTGEFSPVAAMSMQHSKLTPGMVRGSNAWTMKNAYAEVRGPVSPLVPASPGQPGIPSAGMQMPRGQKAGDTTSFGSHADGRMTIATGSQVSIANANPFDRVPNAVQGGKVEAFGGEFDKVQTLAVALPFQYFAVRQTRDNGDPSHN
ncbi:hypothetical protein HOP50_19g84390 [Chloropicon primus]|nr:hypothetical protein HOP50_19g84390 [Chloropicon primus]